jgi:hypothetical protein
MRRYKLHIIAALTLLLSACSNCSEKDGTLVCGVPVKGTAWELAATVASHGEGGFVPECVEQYADKAYIKGWIDTNGWEKPYRELPYDDGYVPAEIICDVENGSVTHALLYCEILDKE